jgi:hypothetical protein
MKSISALNPPPHDSPKTRTLAALASVKSYFRRERKSVKMTIVGWPLYSEFEVDKSLSGDASSGVFQALLKEFGDSVEAETNCRRSHFVARHLSLVRAPR